MSFLSEPITLQSLFGKNRQIGQIKVNVIINESTNDTLTVTKQPVQQGASITDHAYQEPTAFSMTALFKDNGLLSGILSTFSNSGLSKIYQELLDLQATREPFDIITPKRIYSNMLMTTLAQTTDKHTENCLSISMSFQEVIIASIASVTVEAPRSRQRNPGRTGGTQKAGKKSALRSAGDAVVGLVSR